MIRRTDRCGVLAAALLFGLVVPAFAEPRVAITLRTGDASAAQTSSLTMMLDELERAGFVAARDLVAQRIGGRMPKPGVLDAGETAASIAAACERGFEAFQRAEYGDALKTLEDAVQRIQRNPGMFAVGDAHAREVFHAYAGVALSLDRMGDKAGSSTAMIELLRTFTRETITRSEYGPEAAQLYRDAQKQTQAMGHGQLAIKVDDEHAVIFVNNTMRGFHEVVLSDLIPGDYHVYIQITGVDSWQYQLTVHADQTASLSVKWRAQAALAAAERWLALVVRGQLARDQAASYLGSLAQSWALDELVAIEPISSGGGDAVRGTLYRSDGSVVRSSIARLERGRPALRALAGYLADGTPSSELVDDTVVESPSAVDAVSSKRFPAWPIFVGGAAATGAGIWLLAIDQNYGHVDSNGVRTAQYRNTAPWGVAAGSVGIAAIGAGIWWAVRGDGRAPSFAMSLRERGASLAWSGRF